MKSKLLFSIFSFFVLLASNAQPGTLDLTFNAAGIGAFGGTPPPAAFQSTAECIVYKSRIYESGANQDKIIIVGRFTSFNGVAKQYIARLNKNGTLDATFTGPTFSAGYLYVAEILPDGKILIGGVFTTGGYSNFARLNPDGSLDTTFNVVASGQKGTNGPVHALNVLPNGYILVGGNFSTYNTVTKRLLRLLPNGNPDPTFSAVGSINAEVRTIAMQNDKILAGGFFTGFANQVKNKILRLNSDGSLDETFNPGGVGALGGTAVFDIKVLNGKIFVGGKFDTYNGENKRSIIRLNEDGTLDADFNVGDIGVTNPESNAGIGAGYNVFTINIQPDGKLLLGGNFTQYNGINIPKGLARIYQDGGRDLTFVTGAGFTGGTLVYEGKSVVRDIALQSDGKIITGGDFTQYNGQNRRMIARIITRDCDSSSQFLEETGWQNGELPVDATTFAVIYSGTYTIPTGTHLRACELEIKPGAALIISANASITVENNIVNNGTLIVENSGSLIQVKDNSTNLNLGSGMYQVKRVTTPVRKFDFTYWSSPIQTMQLSTLSPATLADKYFKWQASNSTWQTIMNGNENMTPGRGYIVRAPNNFSTTVAQLYTAIFTGKPNNGIISSPVISASGNNKWNLLGNPYPSALNVLTFLDAPENAGLAGTVYLWTHMTPPAWDGTQHYLYTSNDYATFNKLGYAAPSGYDQTPFNGMIASGQAFFIQGITNNSTAVFKNSMRSATTNYQFYRTSENVQVSSGEKHRMWINLTNDQGAFSQTLLGYATNATTGIDRDFDGETLGGNYVSLYSLVQSTKLTIQGRPLPFNADDIVPLGFSTTISGKFTISMPQFDGLFKNQNVYLKDNVLNIVHNLKTARYDFTSATGTFNNRFAIVFAPSIAARMTEFVSNDVQIITNPENLIVHSADAKITQVSIFDINGRLIYESAQISSEELAISTLPQNNSLLLVKTTFEDGSVTWKKILY